MKSNRFSPDFGANKLINHCHQLSSMKPVLITPYPAGNKKCIETLNYPVKEQQRCSRARGIFYKKCSLSSKSIIETWIYSMDLWLQFRINSITTGNQAQAVSQEHTAHRCSHTS